MYLDGHIDWRVLSVVNRFNQFWTQFHEHLNRSKTTKSACDVHQRILVLVSDAQNVLLIVE